MGNGFDEFCKQKIQAVQGDLIQEGLGLSEDDRQTLVENCQIIINSAASVSFNDPLHEALNINYFGSLRVMELAKACRNILAYCHVSTAYVNCNREKGSYCEEEIYDQE